jgi:ferric-dicitrate binding protein FerR (iron transport regulator)
MNVPRHAAAAAKLLRRALSTATTSAGDRARGLATIERAMQVRARRRRWRQGLVAAAAAATLLGLGLAHRHFAQAESPQVAIQAAPLGSGATLSDADRAQRLEAPAEVKVGQLLETPRGGGASLQLSTGTNLTLAGETELRVQSQSSVERFALLRGEMSARVAKLSSGQRFIVQTPDAEVEVRGTRFTVAVLERGDACSAHRTRLRVHEGVVEVRFASGVARLTAAQSWPPDCGEQTVQVPLPALPITAQPPPAPVHKGGGAADNPHEGASALTHQNDLFAEAVALRRRGDLSAALRVYQQVIRQYPSSPLAENAAVERLRLLNQAQPAAARAEARGYLKRYPRGFAVEEAKRLVEEP